MIEGKRFNDGVIDISSLRKAKEEEVEETKEVEFDANKVMESVPRAFAATSEDGDDIELEVLSAIVHPKGIIYIVLTDNIEGEPPFIMIADHDNQQMLEGLRPATEQQFMEFQQIMATVEYDDEKSEEPDADLSDEDNFAD